MPGPSGTPDLPVSALTYEVEFLRETVGLLRDLVQQGRQKRVNFSPLPMPKTARQVVADRKRQAHRDRLLELVADAQDRWALANPDEPT